MYNVRAFDSAEIVASSERLIAKRQCSIYNELQKNVQVFKTVRPVKLNGYTYNRAIQELSNVCDISCGKFSYASSYEMLADVRQGAQRIYPDACCECIDPQFLYAVGIYTNQPLRIYNADGTLGGSLANAGDGTYDAYVAKYTRAGAVLWAAHIGGIGDDYGNRITSDQADNIYLTGFYGSNPLQIYNSDGQLTDLSLNNQGSSDAFIVKYTSEGVALWATHIGGIGQDLGAYITTDQAGNVYLSGSYESNLLLIYNADGQLTDISLNNQGTSDAFIVKYNTGGYALWATHIGGAGGEIGTGITTDQAGNVYITGYYISSPLQIYNAGSLVPDLSLNNQGSSDAFIVKYNSVGYALWATHIGGAGFDIGTGITTDQADNIYLTGFYVSNPLQIYNAGSLVPDLSLNNQGNRDAFIVKYTSEGVALWATHIGGIGLDVGTGIRTDQAGNIYITGYYVSSPLQIYNAGSLVPDLSLNNQGSSDAFIVKYTSEGVALWATHIGGIGDDLSLGITTDQEGNVYIGGLYESNTLQIYNSDGTLSPLILTNTGLEGNSFIVKYDSNGFALWASQTGDLGGSSCQALAIA
jgi:hypothetical protein